MTPESIRLLAGILFLLIAVVGGGFTVKELSIPQVPRWGRILSGALGGLFTVPILVGLALPRADDPPTAQETPAQGAPSPGAPVEVASDQVVVYEDDFAATSPESLRLLGVTASSAHDPPMVGDRITVTFSLENAGEAPLPLAYTFVGARDPGEENRDFAESHPGEVLDQGEQATTRGSVVADEAGVWSFWPCYAFSAGEQEAYCPNRWQAFEILVEG